MMDDADALRELLASTIANAHPAGPFTLTPTEYSACRSFLGRFDSVYTANYDLLLYWAVMHDDEVECIRPDDGFRQPEDGPETYVTWEPEHNYNQTIHYLHGALHLFDAGHELRKYTWTNTGVRLIEQVRQALAAGLFPHIVTEGSSEKKLEQIYHSAYLAKCMRSFSNITGGLLTYGLSFSENDQHLVKAIVRGKIKRIAVGVYGAEADTANQRLISTMEAVPQLALDTRRGRSREVEIRYFDAATTPIWHAAA